MRIFHGTVPADFKFVNMESKTSCLFANRQESVVVGTNTGTIYQYDNYEWPPAPIDKKAKPLDNDSAVTLAMAWAEILRFPKESKISYVLFDWQRGPNPDPSRRNSNGDQVFVSFEIPILDFFAKGWMKFRSIDGRLLSAYQPPKRGIRADSGKRADIQKIKEDYFSFISDPTSRHLLNLDDVEVVLRWSSSGGDEYPDGIPTFLPVYEASIKRQKGQWIELPYPADTGIRPAFGRLKRKPSERF